MTEEQKPEQQDKNLLVWQQTIYQKPDGTIDIQMAIDPEFQKHMQQKHFGLIEAFVKQIIGDVIYSMKSKMQSDLKIANKGRSTVKFNFLLQLFIILKVNIRIQQTFL